MWVIESFTGRIQLMSIALGYFYSEYWFPLTVFAGRKSPAAGFAVFCLAAVVFGAWRPCRFSISIGDHPNATKAAGQAKPVRTRK